MTPQRRVILEELQRVHTHPTADAVYDAVRRRMPGISLGTVYRSLERLSEQGLIRKIHSAGAQQRYDGIPGEHYHVRCTGCGRIDDLHIRPIAAVTRAVSGISDFTITGHTLEYSGLCPECGSK